MSLAFTNAATASTQDQRAAASGLSPFARLRAWMEARRHHREGIRQLLAMDAHLLDDIGITRAQAEYLAQQPYAGDWSGTLFPRRQR